MTRFASVREALEFLVSRIVAEARREGVPLSQVERDMLYFSETGWTLPDIITTKERFERECDEGEYEGKIVELIRKAHARARSADEQQFAAWTDAIRTLDEEDHYLQILLDEAGATVAPVRSRGERLKLWGGTLAILLGLPGMFYLADRWGSQLTRGSLEFIVCSAAACAVGVYLVLCAVGGPDWAKHPLKGISRVFDRTK
jgi:hypothetical protein